MRTETTKTPEAVIFERAYPGTISQPRNVRADLAEFAVGFPAADSLLLLASELATNAILHSRSGHPNREFTVHATLYLGDYAWVEVVDAGGTWTPDMYDDEHGRGLAVVAGIAGDGNWGIDGDVGSRVAWFRLNWQLGLRIMAVADGIGARKFEQASETVRSQIADSTLRSGQPAPSGAALSRATGYSVPTCRKVLQTLIDEGVLVSGPSRNARPQIAGPLTQGCIADVSASLSAVLAARRRAAGLTQLGLAALADCSVTMVGHAETGRLWQSR